MAPVERRRLETYTPPPSPPPSAPVDGNVALAPTAVPTATPVDGDLPLYLTRAAYVEPGSASGQSAPDACTIRDPRAIERIGAGTPTPTPRAPAASGDAASAEPRGRAIGISGIRRNAGIDSLSSSTAGLQDSAVTQRLLERATERYGNGDGLRVRIGSETLTMGQLRAQLERDPERFADTLRRNGISVPEFNEILDDALASGVARGTVLDLRADSALAREYRVGGPNGAVVDSHYDRPAIEARAASQRAVETRADLRSERVEGPGFFQMIADAFAELAGLIARAFGSAWNPDTATFDGRVDDAHFRTRGSEAARGPEGLALQALLSQPDGAARLRAELLAQKPASATDAQWRRAVDGYMAGLREGLATETREGRMPTLTQAEGAEVMLYLRAQGYSAEARGHVTNALAQPEPIRGQALRLLNELPDAERANLTALLEPPATERPPEGATDVERRAHRARRLMATGTPEERVAMFETLRRDGFRAAPGSEATGDLLEAIRASSRVPAELRTRYLATIPELGMERTYLASDFQYGLASRLEGRSPAAGATLLSDVEARLHSTDDLERALVGASFHLEVRRPEAGLVPAADQRGIVRSLEAHNVTFTLPSADGATNLRIVPRGTGDAQTISLERYFSDATYRNDVLRRTGLRREGFEGMLQNVAGSLDRAGSEPGVAGAASAIADARRRAADPSLSAEDRRSAANEAHWARLDLRAQEAPQNLELDLGPGSRLDGLFGLRQTGASAALEASRATVIAARDDAAVTITLRGPSSGGRPGRTHTITSAELAEVLSNPPSGKTSEEAFRERWPGLDYRETVHAFATVAVMRRNGQVETADDGSLTLDLTRRHANADLNRLGERLRDGSRGNVRAPTSMTFDVASRSTADVASADRMWSSSTTGAAAGNNHYQYGWFTFGGPSNGQGYFDTRAAETDARARYQAAGNSADPAHVMNALYGLDDYSRRDGVEQQYGTAAGRPEAFLRDPRTGLPARGQDFTVLTFTGSGSAAHRAAFERSAQRIEEMFTRYGGVPASQVERQSNPTPETMYAAVEAEILRDPRAAADRDRARTVVVYYAGHTASDQADGVAGMAFRVNGQAVYFTPEMVARLSALARERGVNLMWVTDACRAGEYAAQPQAELDRAARATGTMTPTATSLGNLRGAVRTYHHALKALHATPSANLHAPMPGWRELEGLGRAA
ncbi:caspase family protein, partial [Myxococcota bacterium]|nr:caspase family protein [Myxococcota bacterium]